MQLARRRRRRRYYYIAQEAEDRPPGYYGTYNTVKTRNEISVTKSTPAAREKSQPHVPTRHIDMLTNSAHLYLVAFCWPIVYLSTYRILLNRFLIQAACKTALSHIIFEYYVNG